MRLHRLVFGVSMPMSILGFVIASIAPVYAATPAITAFSPASGTIGTSVTILGTGFTGTKTVEFAGAGAIFKVTGDTKIVATAPAAVATGTISVTTPKGTGRSKAPFAVTPGAQLAPAGGPPLALLRVSGAGFSPSTAVDIYFDTTDQTLAVTATRGLISLQIQVPASAQPGAHSVTLVARGTNVAAQTSYMVSSNWPMAGYSVPGRNFNIFENTLTTANVSGLTEAWTKPSGGFANPSPFVVANGLAFVGDVTGAIHAYSSAGKLLWMSSPASSLQTVTPVVAAGRVFFGAANGNVYAYAAACRSDGAICTPLWTKSVGTSVTGSLKFYQGQIYAPSSDGSIHVLDPVTGAAETPISGIDTTHGAVTTPVSFASDGTFYYGAGTALEYRTADGSAGVTVEGGPVSPIAVYGGAAFFTSGDGKIHEFGGAGWTAATSGTNCEPAPAVANDLVYAGGCTSLAAFEAGHGTLRWSVTTAGPVFGLSVANGVLYACVGTGAGFGGAVSAYAASYGGLLWTGGSCTGGAPEIVNGTLYAAFASLTAYRLPGFEPNAAPRMPNPRSLRPDYRLRPGAVHIVPLSEMEE